MRTDLVILSFHPYLIQVYLVENNEDSLLRARSRIEDLKLQNVTIFQVILICFQILQSVECFYSWGPVLVDYKRIADLLGKYFCG